MIERSTRLYTNNQPILVTSEFAEIIYFLRNGNLYRRVLLIAPERQSSIVQMTGNTMLATQTGWAGDFVFKPGAFGGNAQVSWQGMNDLSARPGASVDWAKALIAPLAATLICLTAVVLP